jgi:hypothetical protein
MDTNSIEYLLLSYFNEVIWVDENPAQFTISETYKENGTIKVSTKDEFFHLQDLLITSLEDINKFLFEQMLDCNSTDLNFYPKNIITKLFNIKSNKRLKNELNSLTSNNWIITSNEIYDTYIKDLGYNVYLSDEFQNKIVIGEKDSKLIINRNLKEFYLDKTKIKVINLK